MFNETEVDLALVVVSSASMPFIFPNRFWKDRGVDCIDGGTAYNTNLVAAIERCREQVDDDSEITIDIINSDTHILPNDLNMTNAYSNYLIFQDIKRYYHKLEDIFLIEKAYPDVNFRYYIEPSVALPAGLKLLDFTNSTNTYSNQMQGRVDGAKAVREGEGTIFRSLIDRA
mmetsp:Transcript_7046/g.11860  ORF Transcript_7046/g.11860 Transcript_7046/m.11860 type:complete len:172 (+) Transcript_7046:541-1056(+)